jgi:hypothetical protein
VRDSDLRRKTKTTAADRIKNPPTIPATIPPMAALVIPPRDDGDGGDDVTVTVWEIVTFDDTDVFGTEVFVGD